MSRRKVCGQCAHWAFTYVDEKFGTRVGRCAKHKSAFEGGNMTMTYLNYACKKFEKGEAGK